MNMKKRILVVDDQPDITRLLKRGLEQTDDYAVREENDPGAALAAAEEFQPHLILLDVMMPGMDGGELATSLRASAKLKAVPIVFLTAAITKEEAVEREGRAGGWPILAKPFAIPDVVACLERHLAG
jgi:CheY-like chemotaxis protein